MPVDKLPKVTPQPGRQVFPPPYALTGVQTYTFLIGVDADSVQEQLLDPALNAATDGAKRVAAVGDWALVTFNDVAALHSEADGAERDGWSSERETGLLIPVQEAGTGRLLWYFAYLVVDNGYALCTGREVFGFPKAMGDVAVPPGPGHASYLAARSRVVAQRQPYTEQVFQPLWQVQRTAPAPAGAPAVMQDLEKAAAAGAELMAGTTWHAMLKRLGGTSVTALLGDLLGGTLAQLFLKQVPDIRDPGKACYKALTAAPLSVTRLHGAAPLGGQFKLTFADYASHPIASQLGLESATVTPWLGLYSHYDARLTHGEVLWEAGPES